MTQLTLGEAAKTPLGDILDEGAKGEQIVVNGDGVNYHIHITAEKTKERAERISGLGADNPSYMSDDFNDEDPRINKLFYGEA